MDEMSLNSRTGDRLSCVERGGDNGPCNTLLLIGTDVGAVYVVDALLLSIEHQLLLDFNGQLFFIQTLFICLIFNRCKALR